MQIKSDTYRKADNDQKVAEGGNNNADGHGDGNQDGQGHAERGWPTRRPAVLKFT